MFNRFAVFPEDLEPCYTIFRVNQLQVYIQTKANLLISASDDFTQTNTTEESGLEQCKLQDYSKVVTCSKQYVGIDKNPHDSVYYFEMHVCDIGCSSGCMCMLEYSKVTALCSDTVSSQQTLLIYPYDETITGLQFHGNSLSNIDKYTFSGRDNSSEIFHNVKYLILSESKLASLPLGLFDALSELNDLDLSHNILELLQPDIFSQLNTLQILYLEYNNLTQLVNGTFTGLNNLRELHLQNNNLQHLQSQSLTGLYNLRYLRLEQNALTTIHPDLFTNLQNLKILRLTDNNLEQMPSGTFTQHVHLQKLHLDFNNLSQLESGTFTNHSALDLIDLNHNSLTQIQPGTFAGLFSLEIVRLAYNNLTCLLSGTIVHLPELRFLELEHNDLVQIQRNALLGLGQLEFLYLDNNNLASLLPGVFRDLSNLKYLSLQYNNLELLHSGTFTGLPSLLELRVHHNTITQLENDTFIGLASLKTLYLNQNSITELPSQVFHSQQSLQYMNLMDNNIGIVENEAFKGSDRLETLLLANNRLTSFANIDCRHMPWLKILDVSANHIDELDEVILKECHHADLVDMSKNALRWIKSKVFEELPNSTYIHVDDAATCCFITSASCTSPNPKSPYLTCDRLLDQIVLKIFTWILGIGAILGNAYAIAVRLRTKRGINTQALLITNLAASDFLMGIYMLILTSTDTYYTDYFPSHSEQWRQSYLCKIAGSISVLSSEASVFLITLISIDRLVGIKYPFSKYRLRTKSARIAIAVCWCVALIIAIMSLILTNLNTNLHNISEVCIGLPLSRITVHKTSTYMLEFVIQHTEILRSSKNRDGVIHNYNERIGLEIAHTEQIGSESGMFFSVAIFCGLNLVCFLIVAYSYISIFISVKMTSRRASRTIDVKEELGMAKKMAAIVITDFLCWVPVIHLSILIQLNVVDVPPVVYAWVATFVLPINSMINPFLYTLANVISDRYEKNKSSREKMASISQKAVGQSTIVHYRGKAELHYNDTNSLHVPKRKQTNPEKTYNTRRAWIGENLLHIHPVGELIPRLIVIRRGE